MKIALCLHGLFDSLTDLNSKGIDGYAHIKRHILDKGDVDVYIHSWEIEKEKEIINLYSPKASKFEKQKDFNPLIFERGLHKLQMSPRSPFSVLSHIYSVNETVKLAYESNINYDIVIKSRFDLGRINRLSSGPGHHNPYPVQCINFQTEIIPNSIHMANWQHFTMGPADMWFYGDYSIMRNFTQLYQDLEDAMWIGSEFHQFAQSIEGNPGDLSNAIAFYKWWMIKRRIWENSTKLNTTWE
jgi:hypothetical protein